MRHWISAGFVVLGLLHVPPAIGAVSPAALSALYGPSAGDGVIRVLLQHRGAMFALVATACFAAAAVARWRPAAAILAAWSMVGFLGIYLGSGAQSGPLQKVAIADGIGLAVLLPIAIALWRRPPSAPAAATR